MTNLEKWKQMKQFEAAAAAAAAMPTLQEKVEEHTTDITDMKEELDLILSGVTE